ncbi:class I SAM-dependent methyltransferase [Natronococcus wangiae]|uniref:class I SAM-dependent methyltransferase n=1 Tax=Natronococcus wangiae TaxID=3068275 RepID=UPI00273F45A6|nr:class I SAM-dependent methyltransferase [Natronococcus sp. AD5]
MRDPLGLIRRGLERPTKIPRYLWGLLVPSSRWGPEWRRRDGIVLFEPGGYAASPRTRPEFASNLYHEVVGLWAVLDEHLECDERPETSLEVGCGYGRLSPWIARRSETHYGVDPDERALGIAATQYPDLAFARGRASSLPVPDGAIGLTVSWTVLQHVDDSRIEDAAAELRRVLAPGGLLVCCERVRPPGDDHIWPRSVETYERLFEPLSLRAAYERPVEPTWNEAMPTDRPAERVLVFRAP